MIRRLAFFCFLAGLCFPAQAAVFHPEYYKLANGLEIVIVRGALSASVAQMVWYKAGSADDPEGESGLAHYLEHLMFKGTDTMPPGAFSATIAAQGGNENAFTDADATAYYVTAAADRLPLIMQMEADRMRHLRLPPAEALAERDVVLSERQERTDNDPQGLFQERLRAALFPGHPYGRPVIGWRHEIEKITPEDAETFYRTHYAPNNAVLAISGDVSTREVLRLAAATFGRLEPEPLAPRKALPPAPLPALGTLEDKDPRVKQPFFVRQFVAPSYAENKRESAALEVLDEMLAGGEVGLLYRHFVLDERTAGGIDISYDSAARGPAVFFLAATPSPGGDVHELAASMDAYLTALACGGASAKEVQAAKKRLEDGAVFARDRLMAPAQALGEALAVGDGIASVENWPERIEAVTPADVTAALRKLLATKRQNTGFLEPAAKDGAK